MDAAITIAKRDPQEELDELCRTCRKIDFRAPPGACKIYYVGVLPKIFQNSRCPLCRFITSKFRDDWIKEGYRYEDRFSVNKEVGLGETFYTPSGFHHLRRHQPEIMTFLPYNEEDRQRSAREPYWSHISPMIVSEKVPANEKSVYPANGRISTEYLRVDVLLQWLRSCDEEHFPSAESSRKLKSLPTQLRVIDVHEGNLTYLPLGGRYLAMSYVWGPTKFLKLLKDNLAELETPGALFARPDLAVVMKSGMQLVASLGEGFRYIWIDALCILQDPGNPEMQLLIPRMDIIYNNAYATIVAPEGSEAATYGLPGVKGFPRPVEKEEISGLIGNIRVASIDDAEYTFNSMLNGCAWTTRGWTFQERLLSHRSVYLCEKQMYFECSKGCACAESWVNKCPLERGTNLCFRLHNVGTPRALDDGEGAYGCPNLRLYDDILRAYTQRRLTQGRDILNAMKGIMAQWESTINMKFTNGLPYLKFDDLGLSLLWYGPVRRRVFERGGQKYCPFPSWSWCGLEGIFGYPHYILQEDPNSFVQDYHSLEIVPGSKFEFVDVDETKGWGGKVLTADLLCITAHSAIFHLSSIPVRFSSRYDHKCVYDADGVHCGVTISLDPKLDGSQYRMACEAIRLFSKGGDWSHFIDNYSIENNVDPYRFLREDLGEEESAAYADPVVDTDSDDEHKSNAEEDSDDEDVDEVGLFNKEVYKESANCLVQVMFIGRHGELAERYGIGLIHEHAFQRANSTEKRFKIV